MASCCSGTSLLYVSHCSLLLEPSWGQEERRAPSAMLALHCCARRLHWKSSCLMCGDAVVVDICTAVDIGVEESIWLEPRWLNVEQEG